MSEGSAWRALLEAVWNFKAFFDQGGQEGVGVMSQSVKKKKKKKEKKGKVRFLVDHTCPT